MAASHAQIIKRNGSDPEVAEPLGAKVHQVRDWRLRNSIPSEWWNRFAARGFATLEELSDAAAVKIGDAPPPREATA